MSRSVVPGVAPVVLHVTNMPTPYRLPQYHAIRSQLADVGYAFHVYFLGRGNRERRWVIPPESFEGIEHTTAPSGKGMRADLLHTVDRLRPAAVVIAWAMDPTALRLLFHCRLRAIPCILYTGENSICASFDSHPRLRTLFRIPFFRLSAGFIAYGSSARAYLRDRGVPDRKISIAINVVDTAYFRKHVGELRDSPAVTLERSRYRRPDGAEFECHILFVGYFVHHKGIAPMLEAFRRCADRGIALHIVGSGPLEEMIRERIREYGIESSVFLHGYKQQQEMPMFYAMSDLLLFPSIYEVFGLVMVEAAAAGLPIVASRYAGGAADVVLDGVSGLLVDPSNSEEHSAAILRLAADPALRQEMGRAAAAHAAEHLTLELSAGGYVEAIVRLHGGRVGAEERPTGSTNHE